MYSQQPFIQTELWKHGPIPGQFYNFPGTNQNTTNFGGFTGAEQSGVQHSSSPITTGTSVIGIKFDGGVMIAADNLISYGSLARYQDVQRVFKINEKTIIGAGGDFADFQSLKRSIDQKMVEDMCYQDDIDMQPKSLYNWLTRVLYNRRSRVNPLWLEMVVGGIQDGAPFLGHVDLRGRAYEDDVVATGFGKHFALPLVREQISNGEVLTQAQASQVLRKCMEVLYYRDCRAISKFSVAVATAQGTIVQGPFDVNQNWEVATMVKGY
ncbi:PREDICTED: proteasome subunit beta type-4 isoform X2 [Rhagoletis zephyria]|uniref:proteasome subunit beta type-4 n=1 Tax=Rhagoletis pomonella TaxID=28610 RepID=UPI0008119B93|nr:PREDICTED: proteasome subunit beta type-4 isoform X2 [Rhagoletis zephyria]XP_036335399.1 proteasome subunit beta type-4 [Rhagoletis pomonella]